MNSDFNNESIDFIVPNGIPSLAIVKMMKDTPMIKDHKIEYTIANNSEVLTIKLLKKEGDIAIVPSSFAGQLYNKGLDYKIVGTVGWGALYIVSYQDFNSINGLKSLNIGIFGKGLTPDIIFQNILTNNGIDTKKDTHLTYVSSPNELVPLLLSKKLDAILLPEPLLSSVLKKDKNLHINLNLNSEWEKIYSYGFPQSTLIMKEYLGKNKEFVQELTNSLNTSINFLDKDNNNLREYLDFSNIKFNSALIKDIFKNANLHFKIVDNSQKDIYNNYFKIIFDVNPKSLGGKIPNEQIFIEK